MKTLFIGCILAVCALTASAEIKYLDAGIDVEGNKNIYDDNDENNIEALWGRLYISPHFESDRFDGLIQLYVYPAGFGYQLLRGAKTDSIGEVVTESEQIANVQIWEAWGKLKAKSVAWSFGHLLTYNGRGTYFGNYLDESAGGWFWGKGLFSNATELSVDPSEKDHISLILGSENINLNTGYLRLFNELTLAEKLVIGTGYRTNVFDRAFDNDAIVQHQAALNLAVDITEFFSVYAEAGFSNMGGYGDKNNVQIPILFGVNIPTKEFLDACNIEVEIIATDVSEFNYYAGVERDRLQYSLFLEKDIGDHFAISTGLWTEGKMNQPTFGLRLHAEL